MGNIRVIHDGSFIHPGGSGRVALEIAKAFDCPITVVHSSSQRFWEDTNAEFPFQSKFHQGLSGKFYSSIPKHYAELDVAISSRSLSFTEDILISTSVATKFIPQKWYQAHVNYCHVPPIHYYEKPASSRISFLKRTGMAMLDKHYTSFCQRIIANSEFTKNRIQKHYQREAVVVNPPVRTEQFLHAEPADYFVMIARLVPMKRPVLVAKALQNTKFGLKIIGDGPLKEECEKYGAEIIPNASDSRVEEIVAKCVGGIAFGKFEHCGITPKEIQAAGKPMIVPNEPNLKNHVTPGISGLIVETTESEIVDAVNRLTSMTWDPAQIMKETKGWSREAFHDNMREIINQLHK